MQRISARASGSHSPRARPSSGTSLANAGVAKQQSSAIQGGFRVMGRSILFRMGHLLAVLLAAAAFAAEPKPPAKPSKSFDAPLAEEFRLKKNQAAKLDGGRAVLWIESFINSPCPKNARCIWSGQDVIWMLEVDGKPEPRPAPSTSPYLVEVKKSDYKSWARFIVTKRPADAPAKP